MSVAGAVLAHLPASRALQQRLFALLLSCDGLRSLTRIHAQIIVNGLADKNFILAKLLSFYISSGSLSFALKVFENIGTPSTAVWNQLIRGHGDSPMPHRAVELYEKMVAAGAGPGPDEYTYSYLLSACVRSGGLFRVGEQLHGRVLRNGYCSNVCIRTILVRLYDLHGGDDGITSGRKVFDEMGDRNVMLWNTLLAGYVRRGDIDTAWRVFHKMPEKNVVSWTTVISGCAKNGNCRKALSLFSKMQMAGVELDQVALIAVLSACAELGDLRLGKWIHSYVVEKFCAKNQPVLVSLNNAVIHMYASCGLIDRAYEVFRLMPRRSTVSWTTMITGFAKQGLAEEALATFHLMLSLGKEDEKPDEVTFLGVLGACSHGGLVDEGRNLFKSMKQSWGIDPRIEHFGSMVDLLSRSGHLDEAHKLIQSMPMEPNDVVWGALLGGCRIHKKPELASLVARKLVHELSPDIAAGYLSMLSDIYAIAKRWKEVADIRQMMAEIGVRKPAGRSWVQVNGMVHEFVAGDWTNKHSSLIYDVLGVLIQQLKQESEHLNFEDMFFSALE
ncbi:pentatricopeptide repeat-containing protein At5g56310-like [Punica granatum]|uniref:Pentatricopeptide repeat-containing protein At5g56310-like n=1 Tax=Punica granatum TaxID=22663 RepID=A0A218VYJ1_PUNGR|nr:pentatricopeptide repeat-containing protein At5g56310-like [Punica granatum]OWM65278.1 hypothetical protein CDL15_Pgr008868 [Punica granatum]